MTTENKTVLVTFFIVIYGALTVPAYWLNNVSLSDFNALIALYVVFGVVTFILIALLNVYLPHCMRLAKAAAGSVPTPTTTGEGEQEKRNTIARKYGFSMSVFGSLAVALSGTLMLVIVIIIARARPGSDGQSAGLLVTTIFGFITIAGSFLAYLGLPALPTKPWPAGDGGWKTALLELLTPYREMFLRKRNMLFLLLAYTIYTDTLFALYSINSQLYFIEIQPDTFEYSLYSLAGNLYSVVITLIFYVLQLRFQWNLGKCLIFAYALILVVPIWGCIGLAGVNFGFKVHYPHRHQSLLRQGKLTRNLTRTAGNFTSSSSFAGSHKGSRTRPSSYFTPNSSRKARRSCGLAYR